VKHVEFAPAAREELDAAADRYEHEYAGRGVRFYAAVERTAELLMTFPTAAPPYPDVRPELGIRRVIVRGFPFVLVYRVLDDVVRIDAVAHMHRRPRYWARRVR